MTPRTRAWLLIVLIFALCGGTLWGVIWYRSRSLSPAAMLKRLPTDDAVVLYIDFGRLRAGGILQLLDGSKVGEDPEYRAFVSKTDFDWKQDLDAAMIAFAPKGKYMLLRGRFDWSNLKSYVLASDGRCNNSFCKLTGSSPEKRISFFPMQSNLMAMAVSDDESGALRMNLVDERRRRGNTERAHLAFDSAFRREIGTESARRHADVRAQPGAGAGGDPGGSAGRRSFRRQTECTVCER